MAQKDDFEKANMVFSSGKFEAALELYNNWAATADKGEARYSQMLVNRSVCYKSLGKYDLALTDLNEANKINPNNPNVLISLGSAYLKNKDYQEAEKIFLQAKQLASEDPMIPFNLGWVYFNSDRKDEACTQWKDAKKKGHQEAKLVYKEHKCK